MSVPGNPFDMTVHFLWTNAGLSCDGDSVPLTAATLPSVEDIVMRDARLASPRRRASHSWAEIVRSRRMTGM